MIVGIFFTSLASRIMTMLHETFKINLACWMEVIKQVTDAPAMHYTPRSCYVMRHNNLRDTSVTSVHDLEDASDQGQSMVGQAVSPHDA